MKRNGSYRSMAEQGILLASRTSVLALRRRISSDDVRQTEAGKQPGRSIPSAIQAVLIQWRVEARPFRALVEAALPSVCFLVRWTREVVAVLRQWHL